MTECFTAEATIAECQKRRLRPNKGLASDILLGCTALRSRGSAGYSYHQNV
jgi:hypothetical protein